MSRCRESAGILFKRRCVEYAVTSCSQCRKPICATHSRQYWQTIACVTCLRKHLDNPQQRASFQHMRDDPYFYWYFWHDGWVGDPYGEEDYRLFDHAGDGNFDYGTGDEWQGT